MKKLHREIAENLIGLLDGPRMSGRTQRAALSSLKSDSILICHDKKFANHCLKKYGCKTMSITEFREKSIGLKQNFIFDHLSLQILLKSLIEELNKNEK